MESFIQYRRFGTAIKAQLERDEGKVKTSEGLGPHDRTEKVPEDVSPSSSTSGQSNSDEGKPDVEKTRSAPLPHNTNAKDFTEPVEETPREEEEDQESEDDEDDFELSQSRRTLSRTISKSSTQSAGTKLGRTLTGIEIRKRTTNEGGAGNVFVVGYESEDDPLNPHNWNYLTRVRCTVTIAGIGAVVGFASAVDSPSIKKAAQDLGVSEIVESLATGLYLAGFGAGALFAGPFSEVSSDG